MHNHVQMIAPDQMELIRSELAAIAAKDEVTILWASESGSRAWGFESTDSDYDVRFIYLRKQEDYLRVIEAAKAGHSWEDANRAAERLVGYVLTGTVINEGFKFDWASARIGPCKISLSFSRNEEQRMFVYGWDGVDPESAIDGAHRFKNERNQ